MKTREVAAETRVVVGELGHRWRKHWGTAGRLGARAGRDDQPGTPSVPGSRSAQIRHSPKPVPPRDWAAIISEAGADGSGPRQTGRHGAQVRGMVSRPDPPRLALGGGQVVSPGVALSARNASSRVEITSLDT